MPRESRKRSESGVYHIMLRGINRQQIFEDDEDYRRFLETWGKYREECGYILYGYCLMPNHVHLMIRVLNSENTPSGKMFPTVNKVGKFVGTLKRLTNREIGFNIWQTGSNDRIIRNDEEYIAYMEYIEANPQKWLTDEHYVAE